MTRTRYGSRIARWGTALFALTVITLLYQNFSPTQSEWFPRCPFFHMTGLQCPACGSQRALHAFLNGHFSEAIAYNPFLAISLPYLGAIAFTTFSHRSAARRMKRIVQGRLAVNVYLCLFVGWWVIRNIA